MPRGVAVVVVGLSLCAAFSCGNNKGQPPPDVVPQDILVIELMGPPNGSDARANACQDPATGEPAQAWIVEVTAPFEIDSARNSDGTYDDTTLILAFDDQGRRTCATGPCGRPWIPRLSEAPVHVRVEGTREGTDVVGDDTQSFTVVCRGETLLYPRDIAVTDCLTDPDACIDARSGSGTGASVLLADGGYPPLLESQTPEYRRAYNARVRMLAVGRRSPAYTSDPFVIGETVPWLAYAQATALANGEALISGGAQQPGLAESTAYFFDPTALQVTRLGGMLGGRRAAHTAVSVAIGAGASERVWLVGGVPEVTAGLDGTAAALNTSIVYSSEGLEFSLGPNLSEGRALAHVSSFTWNTGGADHQRALISGGYTTSALAPFGAGEGTSAAAGVFSGEVGPDLVETMTSTAGRAGSSVVIAPDGMSALVVGGYSTGAPADAANCTDNSATSRLVDCADQFDPAGGTEGAFAGTALAGSPAAAHAAATEFTLAGDTAPSGALIAGGVSDYGAGGETTTDAVTFWLGGGAFAGAGAVTLPEARARAELIALDDGRVLLIGGGRRDANGLFADISADTAIWDSTGFDGATNFGALTCDNLLTDSVLPDCPQLATPRVAHAATKLTDGAGWLEGAVLIVGGATDAFVAAGGPDTASDPVMEILVPAYTCVEELVDVDNNVYENHPPDAVGGGLLPRCEINRRFNDDGDIYRNGPLAE